MPEVVATSFSAKKLSRKFLKTYRKTPVLESLFNNATGLQAVRLATLLKTDSSTGVSETAVSRYSSQKMFLKS